MRVSEDKYTQGISRIPCISKRVNMVNTRVALEAFPDLFSSGAKKYIVLETQNRAAQMGPIASPEQAIAFVEQAATELAQEMAAALPNEVNKIVELEKDKILDRLVVPEDERMGEPAAPQIPVGAPDMSNMEDMGDMGDEAVMPPGASNKRAQTQPVQPLNTQEQSQQPMQPQEPAEAVDNAQTEFPQLIVDGPAGEEQIPVGDMDLQYLNAMIDQMATGGGQVSFAGTALEGKTKNEKAWYMDIDYGNVL